jgi:hypothetical protein
MTNEIRTSSYNKNTKWDGHISHHTLNELIYSSHRIGKELANIRMSGNLNDKDIYREYRNLQRQKKMLDEDIDTRLKLNQGTTTTFDKDTFFDSSTGIVYDNRYFSENQEIEYVYFEKDEDIEDRNNLNIKWDTNKTRKEIYEDWTY